MADVTAEPTLAGLQRQIYELQIMTLQKDTEDHEKRIRTLEDTATKVNTLMALVFGGGLLSAVNLVIMLLSLSAK